MPKFLPEEWITQAEKSFAKIAYIALLVGVGLVIAQFVMALPYYPSEWQIPEKYRLHVVLVNTVVIIALLANRLELDRKLLSGYSDQINALRAMTDATAESQLRNGSLGVIHSASAYNEKSLQSSLPVQKGAIVRLIEYSSANAIVAIDQLCSRGIVVKVRVAHPLTAPTIYQFGRLINQLKVLKDKEHEYGESLEIICYTVPACFRARQIGSDIFVSWYTYGRARVEAKANPEKRRPCDIDGKENSVFFCSVGSEAGQGLLRQFDQIWDDLTEFGIPLRDLDLNSNQLRDAYETQIWEPQLPRDGITSAIFGAKISL